MQTFARALVLVIAIIGTWRVSASDTLLYTSWWDKEEGRLYRHNNTTGELERMERSGNNFSWSAVIVQPTTKQKTPAKSPAAVASAPKPRDLTPAEPEKAKIQLYADDGKEITDEITDIDRQRAQPAIAAYGPENLPPSTTVTVGDRITGTVMVRNRGDRRIRAMELTMSLNVAGREKPVEHRFFFSEKDPKNRPPEPTVDGVNGAALLYKVDLPTPVGQVKGMPEVKVTYIKFGE